MIGRLLGRCPHPRVRCIHGPEIHTTGGRRGHCLDCGRWLRHLPPVCFTTGRPHLSVTR